MEHGSKSIRSASDFAQAIHELLKDILLLVMVAVADAHPAGMSPDSGGQGQELAVPWPERLSLAKKFFNQMAGLVEFLVVVPLHLAVGFGRNDGSFSGIPQGHQHPLIGIETFVGEHDVGFDLRQQHICSIQIAGLTASEMKANRVA